jgi:hypothetical protein
MAASLLWRNALANQLPFGDRRESSMKPQILITALAALGLSLSCSSARAGWDDSYLPDCCAFWALPWASGPAADYPRRWYRAHRFHKSAHYRRYRVKMRDGSR